ncbi:hypothetical protein D0862_07152 [Hortaea werneckii]|uniref:Endo-1,4-beta-xylanase n=1 Tax=Hortaea werneckii TaxID=91943 RepID=A0A3M7GEN4_HORWE|nr:hypothetical protein D0862_07152 [Hortaea werneckii]
MLSLSKLGLLGSLATATVLADYASPMEKRQNVITSSQTGTTDGFYWSFWTDTEGNAQMTDGAGGEYSVEWSGDSGNFVAGKGYNPGKSDPISYTADFNPQGNGYLSLYGWFTDPLVEYYVVESYGSYNPGSAATQQGTVESDGATYDIYTTTRTNAPSIQGTATFTQYWSVRQDHRTSGTITVQNHFDAWSNLGMTLGTPDYQIIATEGYQSSGSSSVTVGSGGGSSSSGSSSSSSDSSNAISESAAPVASSSGTPTSSGVASQGTGYPAYSAPASSGYSAPASASTGSSTGGSNGGSWWGNQGSSWSPSATSNSYNSQTSADAKTGCSVKYFVA